MESVNVSVREGENKKRSPVWGNLFLERRKSENLCRSGVFLGFGEHSAPVQRIVDDLSDGGRFRIHIHSVARLQVSDDTFRRDLQRQPVQFRIAAGLNMIDSHKPLIERQVRIKSHDCLYSSN